MTTGHLLELRGVTVRFSGLVANQDVDLIVDEGGFDALIGPNGAGKTTLFNVITGIQAPTRGEVWFGGTEVTGVDIVDRARLGISRTFQNLLLVPSLNAVENVVVGAGPFRRSLLMRSMLGLSRQEDRRLRAQARAALDYVGLHASVSEPVGSLPYGERRKVEIARALLARPRLLLFDEPAAGMSTSESDDLAEVLRRIHTEAGVSILLVEHDIGFVRALARRVTVLNYGSVLRTGETERVLADPVVVEAYLGTAPTTVVSA